MLIPNNKQKTKLFQYAGTARFAYNWALVTEKSNYEAGNKFLFDGELRKQFTQLKKTEEFKWLNSVSSNVPQQAIKDAVSSYKRFFQKQNHFPKFKSKKKSRPSFYQDPLKIRFSDSHVKVGGFAESKKPNKQTLNWIRMAEHERIPFGEGVKYYNPRFTFDGINWWVSVGVDYEKYSEIPTTPGIGIDLGVKELAVISDGTIISNINKSLQVNKLEKKRRRLQRSISRRYETNKINLKGGEIRYQKTSNIIKGEKQLLRLSHRLTGIRQNHLHQATSSIASRKPMYVVMEDLNVSGMMKNRYLAKAVQNQKLAEFYRQMQYKCEWNKIEFITVDRWFPSSKTCSKCGCIKSDLKLSERTYICSDCDFEIDRDLNAALNLAKCGELKLTV